MCAWGSILYTLYNWQRYNHGYTTIREESVSDPNSVPAENLQLLRRKQAWPTHEEANWSRCLRKQIGRSALLPPITPPLLTPRTERGKQCRNVAEKITMSYTIGATEAGISQGKGRTPNMLPQVTGSLGAALKGPDLFTTKELKDVWRIYPPKRFLIHKILRHVCSRAEVSKPACSTCQDHLSKHSLVVEKPPVLMSNLCRNSPQVVFCTPISWGTGCLV